MTKVMHEWPLVLFASLAVAGGGLLAAQPMLMALGASGSAEARSQAAWAVGLLLVGLVVSLGHLGQSQRLLMVVRRFGVSRLSTEVVLAGAAIVAGAAYALAPLPVHGEPLLAWLTGVVSVVFLLSLGFVYRLRGQIAWLDPACIGPALTGLAFGFVARAATAPAELSRTLGPTLALLAADAVVFGARWIRIARIRPWLVPAHPAIFRFRHPLLTGRLLLTTLAPAALLTLGRATVADLLFGIGLLVDRLAFYGLAAQHTTEAEIARVEAAIEGR